jgi:hypothetical protein
MISFKRDLTHKPFAISIVRSTDKRVAIESSAERWSATDGTATANGCSTKSQAAQLLSVRVYAARQVV